LPKTAIVHPTVKKTAPPHPVFPKAIPKSPPKKEPAKDKKSSLDFHPQDIYLLCTIEQPGQRTFPEWKDIGERTTRRPWRDAPAG
jgi:hypothetical protein